MPHGHNDNIEDTVWTGGRGGGSPFGKAFNGIWDRKSVVVVAAIVVRVAAASDAFVSFPYSVGVNIHVTTKDAVLWCSGDY